MTLDVAPLDLAVEDHAPNTAVALAVTEELAGIVEELLVAELLIAAVVLAPETASERLGDGTRQLLAVVTDAVAHAPAGALPDEVHRGVVDAIRTASPLRLATPPGGDDHAGADRHA